jgi:hypothetical protein
MVTMRKSSSDDDIFLLIFWAKARELFVQSVYPSLKTGAINLWAEAQWNRI